MSNLFIRNIQLSEMNFPIQLNSLEDRNPGLFDAEYFYRTDPGGFFAAFLDEKPAGCISAVSYGKNYGFIGMHIVLKEFALSPVRDELLKAAMKKLEGRNIGINCLPSQKEYYESFGFKFAHRIYTFEGLSHRNFNVPYDVVSPYLFPFPLLHQFDKKCFPYDRKAFIQFWLSQPKSLIQAVVNDNKYSGYGLFRPCETGYSISPLFSDDCVTAEKILSSLIYYMEPDQPFYMDIPEPNDNALGLADRMEMKKAGESLRMYSISEPDIQLNNIYSFTSSVLG